jgi:hypothetical protein
MIMKMTKNSLLAFILYCLSNSSACAFGLFDLFTPHLNNNSNYSNIIHTAKQQGLDPHVLQLALNAYDHTREEGLSRKPILTVIDYSKPSSEARLWVIDLAKENILYHELVAHGKNSGDKIASQFSDESGSLQSSLGVFVTESPYIGKHGYSLHVAGLEKGFNTHARSREIVVHAAPYVSAQAARNTGRIGRSWGCFALSNLVASKVINTIKGGSVIFAYYPQSKWLRSSHYLLG